MRREQRRIKDALFAASEAARERVYREQIVRDKEHKTYIRQIAHCIRDAEPRLNRIKSGIYQRRQLSYF